MPTDEEDAAINAGIASDPDTVEVTAAMFAEMRPASEVMPPNVYQALVERRVRGPGKTPAKEMISVRLDRDLLERLRESGPGWQARINDTLRKAVMG